jgi:hypothetical protein
MATNPAATFRNRVRVDPAQVARLMRDGQGGMFRFMSIIGDRIKVNAQRRVGVYKPDPADPIRRRRRPGTLRDSIVKRVTIVRGTLVVLVGSDDEIALIHHEGTPPHTITARRRPMLAFYSARAGRVIRVRSVRHPGTQPNRYLTDAMNDELRRI